MAIFAFLNQNIECMQKVSIAKGMRDFNSSQVSKRQYITNTIRNVFETFGYAPLETPSMENLSTLTGKYGDEGDKLIFRVLKSGDFLKSVPQNAERDAAQWSSMVSDKALRYDLTVPFARYIASNRNEVKLPFKRYQMQPVWRADRPQKGRYREFWQCDADVVGSKSLWQEVELMLLYAEVFERLAVPVRIRISNRSILASMAEYAGVAKEFMTFCTILDKVDKIGVSKVVEQWIEMGVEADSAATLSELIQMRGLDALVHASKLNAEATEGVSFVLKQFNANNTAKNVELVFDPSLARGLDYYTGCIFEVEAQGVGIGSIGGGGRYDDLTGIFGVKDVPGVGISFGLDRIYLVLEELNLFPDDVVGAPLVMGVNFGGEAAAKTFEIISSLRREGMAAEFYPESLKMKKQFDYANQKGIRYVLIMGDEEMKHERVSLKDMQTGNQRDVDWKDLRAAIV